MTALVQLGGPDDLDTLAQLWTGMVETHRTVAGQRFPVRSAADSWPRCREEFAGWLADGSGVLWLARADTDSELLGFLICRLIGSGPIFDLGDRRGEVDSLVVADHARGQGVGTALLAACRADLVGRGCRWWQIAVADGNDDALRLYDRLGFRPWVHELVAPLTD